MENAELIKALRHCANDLPCETESYRCKYADIWECNVQLRVDAADALEAAEKRINELESQAAFFDAEKLNYQENIEYRDERIKELEEQMPKEGEWIGIDGTMFSECSVCGERHYGCETPFCDMCGAKMKGANDEQIH